MTQDAQESVKLSVEQIRDQFPILHQEINGNALVYMDNAATTQKPFNVINRITEYYSSFNSNIHRGIHTLAERATTAFEEVREKSAAFINAAEKEELIFTKGTTEGINLIASAFREVLEPGDEVIISGLEHHSNMVPWQNACERSGATLNIIPFKENGELDMEMYSVLLSDRTKIVAFNHASNALGTVNPVKEIIRSAKNVGAYTLVDGAQAAPHLTVDVKDLDTDFYVFSGHKMYGPTGTGVLYGKREALEELPPYQYGGEMIRHVSYEKTSFNDIPYKFEAGTPNIAGVVGLGAAIDFINEIGKENIQLHEEVLLSYAHERLSAIEGLRIYGQAAEKVSVLSFLVDGIHPFDLGQMLDSRGIAVRTGHHCTEPIMDKYGIEGTVRASFAVYNTRDEIDLLADGIERVMKIMRS